MCGYIGILFISCSYVAQQCGLQFSLGGSAILRPQISEYFRFRIGCCECETEPVSSFYDHPKLKRLS